MLRNVILGRLVPALLAVAMLSTTLGGCSDSTDARREAEATKAAQTKAELATAKAQAELANAQAELAKAQADAARAKAQLEDRSAGQAGGEQDKPRTNGKTPSEGEQVHDTSRSSPEGEPVAELARVLAKYTALAKKSHMKVTSLKYDVQKTNSLVSPYIAIVAYDSKTPALNKNFQASYAHQDTFGWQNGRWVVTQRLMRNLNFDSPMADARSDGFQRADPNGRPTGGYVLEELFELEDKALSDG
jgi:osmotically-inducible protein OsmY